MFDSIKSRIDDQKLKLRLSKSNKAEDVEFLMDVLEFTHRTYGGLLFISDEPEHIKKLIRIGFMSFTPLHPGDIISNEFTCLYNQKRNIIIHLVPVDKWDALNLTLDTTAQIFAAQSIPEAKAIGIIFAAISTKTKG
jgi:hypothetical protein